jgi:hypothetical protein
MNPRRALLIVFLVSFASALQSTRARADEKLKDIACRSVHLSFPAPEATAFYNEVAVRKSAPGTFFMVCGWDTGYFGMQELGDGKKLLIFSVWDSEQNDRKAVAADRRVKLIQKDEKVRVGRFGGEGTGGQSFFDFNWKPDTTYRFLLASKVNEKRTEYSGYFFIPSEKKWRHLITFSTITGGKNLRGFYSFIEDFKRDKISATKTREAVYGNGWVQTIDGKWVALPNARFTGDSNPVMNINAGLVVNRFFLATGGEIINSGAKLSSLIELPTDTKRSVPQDLPILAAKSAK